MNKPCVVLVFVLLMTCGAHAQDAALTLPDPGNAGVMSSARAEFNDPGTQVTLLAEPAPSVTSAGSVSLSGFPNSPATSSLAASPHPESAPPTPAPPAPRFVFGGRDDFRWQLGLGISLVRFRSPFYYATGVGSDTSITYFTNDWFGFEGRVTTSFAPTIARGEHVKFVGYGGGPKLAWRAQKFEPFVHALFGGMHILPRTARNSPNGLDVQLGGGAGYRFNPRLSARIVVDWVRTYVFGEWENNAQATLQAVLHF